MIGAIIGDIVGSRFEFNNIKSKNFEFFHENCFFTDDTVMTIAVAKALIESRDYTKLGENTVRYMQQLGREYPHSGYGGNFAQWLMDKNPRPYNSFGNGAAMRVSACAYAGNSLKEVRLLSRLVTEVTHNHPEGIKGAEATAVAAYLARTGMDKAEIRDYIVRHYYNLDFTLDDIRPVYQFNETCQGSVPQALEAFFEANSFEDTIRNAISIGGDSDTLGAIAGAVAEAYYGVPFYMRKRALGYLGKHLLILLNEFEYLYPSKKPKNELL